MHYEENTLFDIDPKVKGVKVTQNVAQYPHFTRVPTVREKSVKNEKSSRSGKSQGILS